MTRAFSRLDPNDPRNHPRAVAAKPRRSQSALELALFGIFGASIILSFIAIYAMYSPDHRLVPNRVAEGMQSGRVNVLIIGTDQSGRDVVTESLTLLSVKPDSPQAAMISLPRDLWVKINHFGTHRIANAFNIGESSGYPGEGPGLASDTVERVIGQPVHAYIRVDTSDLQQTIDALGGIDVVVQHNFLEQGKKDRFKAGPVHLAGQRAIRYAQSTAVVGPQGTPFAREVRQQQVIAAVVQKVTAPPQVRTRLAAAGLAGALSSTNLTPQQADALCRQLRSAAVRHVTLEPLVTQFEVRSLFDAGKAVRPLAGDYAKVRELTRDVFASAQPIAAIR